MQLEKAIPADKRGRKATGLNEIIGLPWEKVAIMASANSYDSLSQQVDKQPKFNLHESSSSE